jgi:hypothetical protein
MLRVGTVILLALAKILIILNQYLLTAFTHLALLFHVVLVVLLQMGLKVVCVEQLVTLEIQLIIQSLSHGVLVTWPPVLRELPELRIVSVLILNFLLCGILQPECGTHVLIFARFLTVQTQELPVS